MNIVDIALSRHATKAFDPTRTIPADLVAQIESLLRLSPSSTNAQPWHFILASSEEGRARIAKAAHGPYSANEPKIRQASHVVVFCTRASMEEAHLQAVLAQENADGRFRDEQARGNQHRGRSFYVDMHRFERRDVQHWMEKQVYLAAGTLLFGAAALHLDACPIEGFDQVALDAELDLRAQGLTSALIVALGYRSEQDFNASLPKSRLPLEQVITRL